jgi:hypothetical protein
MLGCFFEERCEEEEKDYRCDNPRDWEVLSHEVKEDEYGSNDSYMHYCNLLQKYSRKPRTKERQNKHDEKENYKKSDKYPNLEK